MYIKKQIVYQQRVKERMYAMSIGQVGMSSSRMAVKPVSFGNRNCSPQLNVEMAVARAIKGAATGNAKNAIIAKRILQKLARVDTANTGLGLQGFDALGKYLK